MLISPSILSCDFGKLNEEIKTIDDHCDFIHVDVMDGHFVPNITIWAPIVNCIKSKKPIDCHLMIDNPEKYISDFAKAWAQSISTHAELWENSVLICANYCKKHSIKYWVVLNPSTPVETIWTLIDEIDYCLIMSVHPWFWWQTFETGVLDKVRKIKEKHPELLVQIDWWINESTVKLAKDAWVDNVVAWSYIFKAEDRVAAIESLRV